jgi:hypothetical protein
VIFVKVFSTLSIKLASLTKRPIPLKHQESAIVPGALPGVAPASQEEEPVADAQHEKTIDIDSELKNANPKPITSA